MKTWWIGTLAALLLLPLVSARAADLDTAKIEQLTGLKGTLHKQEGVYSIMVPREDIRFTVDGYPMSSFMGLTSWYSFKADRKVGARLFGGLVLCQDEVNPVLSVLLDKGISVTALHGGAFFDRPRFCYLRLSGAGSEEDLAGGIAKACETIKGIRSAMPSPAEGFGGRVPPDRNAITASKIEEALAVKGEAREGMFRAAFGRSVKFSDGGRAGKLMGVGSCVAFAGTDDYAYCFGHFAVKEDELTPVLKELRKGGINIVGIDNAWVGESPRLISISYWGKGEALPLAHTVNGALALTTHEREGDVQTTFEKSWLWRSWGY